MAVGRQCGAGLLMQGLIYRDPFEDDRLVAKSYIFCPRRRERDIIWQPACFSRVVHIFLHLISRPGSGSPRLSLPCSLFQLWQQLLRVAFQPPYPSMVNSVPWSVTGSRWVFLAPRAWQSSAAVIQRSHFLSSPDAQGRCYVSGVFGGGGLHGLASMGHRSTAVLAVSITALGSGLFRTSPFPAWLVCSSDLSRGYWFFFSHSLLSQVLPRQGMI